MENKNMENWKMADHTEAWWREQGKFVPNRNTDEWQKMYEKWIDYAFADFKE